MSELVFVYGTLKEGFSNHHVLGEMRKLIGEATTVASTFSMLDLGAFPAVSLEGGTTIKGEVYSIPNLKRVDSLEGYPHFYNRMEVETTMGSAWMYFVKDGDYPMNEVIPSGEWVKNKRYGFPKEMM